MQHAFIALLVLLTPPELPDGTDAASKRLSTFRVPEGMKVELFAAEPKLASPVAIGLDERNRVFVAEEYRFNLGTEENRTRPFFLEDDLQLQTLDDRLKMYEKFSDRFAGGMDWFRKVADQVRLVEDVDGDGKADRSTVFAPDFNGVLDGLAAGVMAQDGDVYFTCIPNLWRLRDTDGDGIADERSIIHTGFGVNAGFLGHDLHGLCWGPDGKLYFSIGDRGFHVTTKEGSLLHGPRTGAVFRCFPDGSDLEVVCRGLRNPQELAFDQFGNLFAADNNCDKGDHSRLVYCLPGSDSGWNMAYQSIPEPYLTGPWHAEKTWHLWNGDVAMAGDQKPDSSSLSADRPAGILPAVGKLGAGPSGLTYYPGTGLSSRYDHHFFLCNYTGNGGVESFSIRPRGAGFEVIDEHDFLKPISATDCEFGYDGKLYVSDFVNLIWNGGSSGGRIYTVFDKQQIQTPLVRQTAELVRNGFQKLPDDRLVDLLSHPDLRIRQRSQFELAHRGEGSIRRFQQTVSASTSLAARLHAIWGLGQLAAKQCSGRPNSPDLRRQASEVLMSQATNSEDEIRAWSIRLLGENGYQPAAAVVAGSLLDPKPRVRLFAMLAMSHLKYDSIPDELLLVIRENNNADPWLRHGAMMAVQGLAQADEGTRLGQILQDKSPAVRLVGILASRHLYRQRYEWSYQPAPARTACDLQMESALWDEDPRIVTEASRAINDLPLEDSQSKLASLAVTIQGTAASMASDALVRRIINANFRLGEVEQARQVLRLAVEPGLSVAIRKEALAALVEWDQPGSRDRVTGYWRPVKGKARFGQDSPVRDPEQMAAFKSFLAENIAVLLGQSAGELQPDVVRLITRHQLPTDDAVFAGWIADSSRNIPTQVAALRLLATRKSPLAAGAIETGLKSDRAQVRAESRDMLAALRPDEAVSLLQQTADADTASTLERQRAIAMLASLKLPAAESYLKALASRLIADQIPESLQLDVVEGLTATGSPELKQAVDQFRARLNTGDLLTRHRLSLQGGNVERGRDLFIGHRVGQCVRCHKVGVGIAGGTAGPDLHQVAARHDRLSLLQSLLDPSAKIAKGYETVTLVLSNGQILGGLIRKEGDGIIVVEQPDGTAVTVKASDVEERSSPKSAMPEMSRALTSGELRDLVEFLSTLK